MPYAGEGSGIPGHRQYGMSVAHLADTPATWPQGSDMSTLHAIVLFVGGPLLIIAVITLLVMAPSLAKGPRYRPSQQWDADTEWFGAPEIEGAQSTHAANSPELEAADARHGRHEKPDDSGGASANW
jgi:hypothetical protein